MQRHRILATLVVLVGALGLGACTSFIAPPAGHEPGPGNFKDWRGPKYKYLHIYLSVVEGEDGCPQGIEVFPDDEAAEIWRTNQPNKIVWKVQGGQETDDWLIETGKKEDGTLKSPDHLPGEKTIKRSAGQTGYWSRRPVPAGQSKLDDWRWEYMVELHREGCAKKTLDPPVHIRR
jgi:hypothetical protein